MEFLQLLLLQVTPAKHLIGSDIDGFTSVVCIRRCVKERIHPVVFLMRDRVKLVRMALRASDCQPEPDRTGGVHSINQGFVTKLIGFHTTFFVDHRIPMKCRSDSLRRGGVRKQIARKLFNRKLIEWHVAIDCCNNPVSIGPHDAWTIYRVAIGVCIPCLIEPMSSPAFPIMRALQQSIDEIIPRVRRIIVDKRVGLFNRR